MATPSSPDRPTSADRKSAKALTLALLSFLPLGSIPISGLYQEVRTPIYVALGAAGLFFTPGFLDGGSRLDAGISALTLILLSIGAVLYAVGGVVYGFQRPNPWPEWFGFHEVFHTLTILAFASHFTGVWLATVSMR